MSRQGTFRLAGLAFPTLQHLTLVSACPRLDPQETPIPRLEQLVLGCGAERVVPPCMLSLITHPLLCPRTGITMKVHEAIGIGASAVEMAGSPPVDSLVMYFLGTHTNRLSWLALVGEEIGFDGDRAVHLEEGVVDKSVVVKVAALPRGERDARLIARTLQQLLAKYKSGAVAIQVVRFGLRALKEDIDVVAQAVRDLLMSE